MAAPEALYSHLTHKLFDDMNRIFCWPKSWLGTSLASIVLVVPGGCCCKESWLMTNRCPVSPPGLIKLGPLWEITSNGLTLKRAHASWEKLGWQQTVVYWLVTVLWLILSKTDCFMLEFGQWLGQLGSQLVASEGPLILRAKKKPKKSSQWGGHMDMHIIRLINWDVTNRLWWEWWACTPLMPIQKFFFLTIINVITRRQSLQSQERQTQTFRQFPTSLAHG